MFWLPAAISGAAGLLGGSQQNAAVRQQNAASQEFSREMYSRQRADALEFWNLQNAYNSPQAQAKRLEEAGLNKALMYGKGASGGSAGPISTPDTSTAQFRAPTNQPVERLMEMLSQFADVRIKQAQHDNLKAQNDAIREGTLLSKARKVATEYETHEKQSTLQYRIDQLGWSSKKLRSQYDQINQQMDDALLKRARDQRMSPLNLKMAKEKLRSIRNGNVYKELMLESMESLVNENDPLLNRIIQSVLDQVFKEAGWSPGTFMNKR